VKGISGETVAAVLALTSSGALLPLPLRLRLLLLLLLLLGR
jgi:hypothetical protein